MVEKLLDGVRSTEEQADEKVRKMRVACEKIIHDARKKADKIIDKEIVVAENKAARSIASAQEDGEKAGSAKKDEAAKEKERTLQKAQEKFEEAVTFISENIIHGYQ